MVKGTVEKMAKAAMFAAIACVATLVIQIPSPLKGYMNLGDCAVLLAGWLLPMPYGALAAGVGSMLADVFTGYFLYAPITFLLKGLMAFAAGRSYPALSKRIPPLASRLIAGVLAEGIMVLGYFAFESLLYGASPAALNIPLNLLQGALGVALSMVLIRFLARSVH